MTDTPVNSPSKHTTPTHQPPIMTVSTIDEEDLTEQAQKIVDENLLILLEESKDVPVEDKEVSADMNSSEEGLPVYFRYATTLFSNFSVFWVSVFGVDINITISFILSVFALFC